MTKLLPLLALLSACSSQGTAQPETRLNPAGSVAAALCRLGFTAIPLRTLASGHHIVDVELNGRRSTFILDTGANATVVHAPLAARFGITTAASARGGAVGLGGGQSTALYPIRSFTVGGMPARQSEIATLDLSQFTEILSPLAGRPIEGIVGQDFMTEHRAVIDVRAPALYVIRDDVEPAPNPARRCR